MRPPVRMRVDRLAIHNREMTANEARDLVSHLAEALSRNWREGVHEISRSTLSIQVNAPQNFAVEQLANLVARELKKKLL